MSLTRRHFIQQAGLGLLALTAANLGYSRPAYAKSKRVVVLGGGWGGTTVAKHLKKLSPDTEVVLIEKNRTFVSCPFSNTYLSGKLALDDLTFPYTKLSERGVKVVHEWVTAIDTVGRKLRVGNEDITYDYLVLSPGIDYNRAAISGLEEHAALMPAAFKPGEETVALKKMVDEYRGGNIILTVPPTPFRCPPGPYERVCQIAYVMREKKLPGKLLVLDSNPDVVSKPAGFKAAWKELYPDQVEYLPGVSIRKVAVKGDKRIVSTDFDDYEGTVANIIPPMRAGQAVFMAGVNDAGWASINPLNFESTKVPNVFVIGDANTLPGAPKSGTMANAEGHIVAKVLAARIAGEPDPLNLPENYCYSWVDHQQAIVVQHSFTVNPDDKKALAVKANTINERSPVIGIRANEWARGIWDDMLG